MASDMNWMKREPIASWVVVSPLLNPFFLTHAIDGSRTCFAGNNLVNQSLAHFYPTPSKSEFLTKRMYADLDDVPVEIRLTDEAQLQAYKDLGLVVWTQFSAASAKAELRKTSRLKHVEKSNVGRALQVRIS